MRENKIDRKRFRIGDLTLDAETHEVRRGDSLLDLPPLSFALLVLLVERAPSVVSHQEMADRVWAGRVVSPETVTQRIKLLRQSLGDDANDPRYVALVRGEGYRLIAEVEPLMATVRRPARRAFLPRPPARAQALGVLLLTAFAATAVAYLPRFLNGDPPNETGFPDRLLRENSIAVLPFADMTASGERRYLAEGIADEILHRLGGVPELLVIARTSSFALGDRGLGAREIATRLGARYILQGSIRESSGELRITAQLVDALEDTQLWSEAFNRAPADALGVQGDIAASLCAILEVSLSAESIAQPAPDPEAYRHFVTGNFLLKRRGDGDLERAEESFRAALAVDPTFARAWVGVAAVPYIRLWEQGDIDFEESIELQRSALEKAVAFDPALPEAHVRLSNLYFQTDEPELAAAHLARARELDPFDPLVLGISAGLAGNRGDFDEAVELNRQVVARDPLSALARNNLAWALLTAGLLEEAEAEFRRTEALSPSRAGKSRTARAAIRILEGEYEAALRLVEDLAPSVDRDAITAMAAAGLGRQDAAEAAIGRLSAAGSARSIARLAEVRAFRNYSGAVDEALTALRELAQQSGSVPVHDFQDALTTFRYSPFLREFRQTQGWQDRLASVHEALSRPERG